MLFRSTDSAAHVERQVQAQSRRLDQAHHLLDRFPRAELRSAEPDYERTVAQVVGLV